MIRLISATGMVEVDTYIAIGDLMGMRFGGLMVPASTPLLGCDLLQILRFKGNPVTGQLENIPDDEPRTAMWRRVWGHAIIPPYITGNS